MSPRLRAHDGPPAPDGGHAAWIVDLDGTLYDAGRLKLAIAVELCLFAPASLRALAIFRREHERMRQEGADFDDLFQSQLERAARRVGWSSERLEATVGRWMFQRSTKWIRAFRNRPLLSRTRSFRAHGGLTAVVSDYPARAKLQALEAADLFDACVAAGERGGPRRFKPAPEGLLLAATALGVEPHECLVLGDRPDADGEAARRAGMAFELVT